MRALTTLISKEVSSYFISPMAYIILTAFLFLCGLTFYINLNMYEAANMPARYADTLNVMSILSVMITPLITMRLIAEEKNRGTIETLLTAPVTETQVVLSKFIAALLFYMYLLIPTVVHHVVLGRYSNVDEQAVATGYLGVIIMAASLFSIGILVSALCNNQITAGIITLVVALALIFIHTGAYLIKEEGILQKILLQISFIQNIGPFMYGIIDTRPLVMFLSVIIFFLFLTIKVIQARRFR